MHEGRAYIHLIVDKTELRHSLAQIAEEVRREVIKELNKLPVCDHIEKLKWCSVCYETRLNESERDYEAEGRAEYEASQQAEAEYQARQEAEAQSEYEASQEIPQEEPPY